MMMCMVAGFDVLNFLSFFLWLRGVKLSGLIELLSCIIYRDN